ncbi:MAG: hypothetical protein DDT36_00707 [Firmicutes bacterium]|nr:hypothetical protein [Bacillota bacterium]
MKRLFPASRVIKAMLRVREAERRLRQEKASLDATVSKFASARGYVYLRNEDAERLAREEIVCPD